MKLIFFYNFSTEILIICFFLSTSSSGFRILMIQLTTFETTGEKKVQSQPDSTFDSTNNV